ncbi:LysR family transcriptional regulator [Paenibacillus albus]|uniref:LysR family transcriptional regulator n=1 Tax=Paenibacillus albus TaxID=2495582 RepID=UPI0013E0A729|nr:LysR family transcriptional regulator [Paenibacillus albus]
MNLDQLYYIIEVAKTKSLSLAASNMHVTQSAISQSIAGLEAELGIPIFIRSRSGTTPTKEGTDIIQKALEVVSKLQEMKDGASRVSEMMHAELKIAAIPGVMASLVKTVSSFKQDYPNVAFRIVEEKSDRILDEIRHNKVDIGLIGVRGNEVPIGTGLVFEPIWQGRMVVGVWNNSPLAGRKRITPEEMKKLPYVLYDEPHVHDFVEEFTGVHGPLSIMFTSNNPYALVTVLRENLAGTIGYDFSFIDRSVSLNSGLTKLEIDGVEQPPIQLGWARAETNKGTQVSKMFIQRFKGQIQLGNLS